MAVQSTWFQMNPQILLEYRTDRYKIISGGKSTDPQPERYYIYEAHDGRIAFTEDWRYEKNSGRNWYKNQGPWLKFPDYSGATYRWLKDTPEVEYLMGDDETDLTNSVTIVKNANKSSEAGDKEVLSDFEFIYDSVNVYFLRGYQMDGIDGITLAIKTGASCETIEEDSVYKSQQDVYLLDAYIDKSMLFPSDSDERTDPVHRLASPLYMNSKFYDKYITIQFPSPYAIALRDRNLGSDAKKYPIFMQLYWNEDGTRDASKSTIYTINPDSNIILEFATVLSGNTSQSTAKINNTYVDSAILLQPEYANAGCVLPQTNTDFFNARIYEDGHGNVIYTPMYGDVELNTEVMGRIQTGEIPVVSNAFKDAATSYPSFNDIDTGDDSLYYADSVDDYRTRWKIYSDLVATYVYSDPTSYNGTNALAYDETYSRVIDYAESYTKSQRDAGIEFWKTKFTPDKDIINQLGVERICLKYTCRLVNEMRGLEAVRIATLFIDPQNYTDNIKNNLNINTYKIINRLPDEKKTSIKIETKLKERAVRTYYNMTSVTAKDMGTGNTSYPQGQLTLKLNRTSNNYAIQLFNLNSDNVRIPYDLTGPYKYKLVMPTTSNMITVKLSSDIDRQQLGLGILLFYITSEQAAQVMEVASIDRYFAIMTDGSAGGQETTLYEGRVAWLS